MHLAWGEEGERRCPSEAPDRTGCVVEPVSGSIWFEIGRMEG